MSSELSGFLENVNFDNINKAIDTVGNAVGTGKNAFGGHSQSGSYLPVFNTSSYPVQHSPVNKEPKSYNYIPLIAGGVGLLMVLGTIIVVSK